MAPVGAREIEALFELFVDETIFLRLAPWEVVVEEIFVAPFEAVGIVLIFPLLLFVPVTVGGLEELIAFVKAGVDAGPVELDPPGPEGIAGYPELAEPDDEIGAEEDRVCVDIEDGVGTREAVEGLAGSSKEGGGKIGLNEAFPVPDGPPPPVRRRGVEPAAPLAALNACCTICC